MYLLLIFNSKTVNGVYVDGVSITLGNPHKHVWTYAAGVSDNMNYPYITCLCANILGRVMWH